MVVEERMLFCFRHVLFVCFLVLPTENAKTLIVLTARRTST